VLCESYRVVTITYLATPQTHHLLSLPPKSKQIVALVCLCLAAIVYAVGKEVVCGIEPIPRETQPLEHSNSQSQRIRGSLAIRDLIAMAAAPATTTTTTTLYVVQHCWFSGPHHHGHQPPVDYMRLLSTLQDAEQVAYASAHWYAATTTTATSTLPNKAAVVRTIQLPRGRMSHHHNNSNVASTATATTATTTTTSSYGFLTCGRLFWVRPVVAKVTTTTATTPASSFGEAHCIVTAGLFGNCTSCLPSRPSSASNTSTEDSSSAAATSLIFVGPHSSHAALQLISSSSFASSNNNSSTVVVVPPGSTVQWVPVGPPPSLDQLAREWPTSSSTLTSSGAFAHHNHNDCDSMDDSSSLSSKRVGLHNAENEWFRTNAKSSSAQQYAASSHHCNKEHRMWGDEQAAARPPPAKRACRPVQADNYYSSSSTTTTTTGGGLVTTTATAVTTSSCTTSVALGGDMEY
jgi:hypothetical protein